MVAPLFHAKEYGSTPLVVVEKMLPVAPVHIMLVDITLTIGGAGTVSVMLIELLFPDWSATVTNTIVVDEIHVPAVGACVITSSSLVVMLSLEIARISSVKSGTIKSQLFEVSSLSKLLPLITGASLSSFAFTVTSNEHSEGLPYKSMTVQVTVVVPISNIWPLRVVFKPVIVLVAPLSVYVIDSIPVLSLAVMSQLES